MFGADAIRWGLAADGLQLGIGVTSTPEPGLRILLKNASPVAQEVAIGFEDHDPLYNVRFTARGPRGDDLQVLDLNTLRYKPSDIGPGPAIFKWLEAGVVHEFIYPLSQLLVANGTETPLTRLLHRGYTIRATFQFRDTAVASPDLPLRR
jgi:hypothetical protein